MTDLISILGTLVDNKGNILIEGLGDLVAPLTEEEKALFPGIAFTMDDIYESLGSKTTIYDNTEQILMARYLTPLHHDFPKANMQKDGATPLSPFTV